MSKWTSDKHAWAVGLWEGRVAMLGQITAQIANAYSWIDLTEYDQVADEYKPPPRGIRVIGRDSTLESLRAFMRFEQSVEPTS